jgi:hypothetical protein
MQTAAQRKAVVWREELVGGFDRNKGEALKNLPFD